MVAIFKCCFPIYLPKHTHKAPYELCSNLKTSEKKKVQHVHYHWTAQNASQRVQLSNMAEGVLSGITVVKRNKTYGLVQGA